MERSNQLQLIHRLADASGRFRREAYIFVLDALHFTQEKLQAGGHVGHISGRQLCEGIREYAESEFGFLSRTVFDAWGVGSTEDFGDIVFQLADAELLAKQDSDSKSDFTGVFAFDDVFEKHLIS